MAPLPNVIGLILVDSSNAATAVIKVNKKRENEDGHYTRRGLGSQFITVMGIAGGVVLLVLVCVMLSKLLVFFRRRADDDLPIPTPSIFRCGSQQVPSRIPLDSLTGWHIRPLLHHIAQWYRNEIAVRHSRRGSRQQSMTYMHFIDDPMSPRRLSTSTAASHLPPMEECPIPAEPRRAHTLSTTLPSMTEERTNINFS
ncbi:hypothetical protein M422DRAFT_37114 [Sphaerobolus stellatus SS14]|uniref:Unplaced genomic scaffold SPHSTscaffold_218, whole genome shotgun sequence n=1 Tax=Sphaerobolus stellatus (strain SS14) TaxID=990650 RepID=A0A0C9UJ96_SPHS4|nr:hypothetical protein M422DRAFT_37114 [Sphaerobolus stellatus SS14]